MVREGVAEKRHVPDSLLDTALELVEANAREAAIDVGDRELEPEAVREGVPDQELGHRAVHVLLRRERHLRAVEALGGKVAVLLGNPEAKALLSLTLLRGHVDRADVARVGAP